MKNSEKILTAVVVVLTLFSAYLSTQYFFDKAQIKKDNQIIKAQTKNENITAFTQLLIDKVLSGQAMVSFDDRLQLENAVRNLNDQEIFDQWQKFVKAGTTQDGQRNLTLLLKLLIAKAS